MLVFTTNQAIKRIMRVIISDLNGNLGIFLVIMNLLIFRRYVS